MAALILALVVPDGIVTHYTWATQLYSPHFIPDSTMVEMSAKMQIKCKELYK